MASHSVSIAFQTDKPITAYGPLAEAVEQYGFSGVTVCNDMLYPCLDQIAEVKIGGTANPRVVPTIQKVIGDAATQDRDSPADIGIAVGAVTIVDRDGKAARETARREAALYLNIIARLDPT